MKSGIHPTYNKVTVHCTSCGNEFESGSVLKDIKVDVKSPNGKVVLGTNIKPKTAVGRIKKWLIEEGKLCTS